LKIYKGAKNAVNIQFTSIDCAPTATLRTAISPGDANTVPPALD
jgi:hypothetical protein